jgi:hypothetical protein
VEDDPVVNESWRELEHEEITLSFALANKLTALERNIVQGSIDRK